MTRGLAAVVATALAGGMVCVPVAAAQDGVIVDPDSAPAKEYALPLNAAREVATGEDRGRERTAAAVQPGEGPPPPPAFGAGVEPRRTAPSTPRRRQDRPAARERERVAPKTPLELVAPSDRLVAVEEGGPVLTVSLAAGLGVLLAALLLAVGARRVRPRTG